MSDSSKAVPTVAAQRAIRVFIQPPYVAIQHPDEPPVLVLAENLQAVIDALNGWRVALASDE